jgi:hypothetical protein
MVQGGRRHVHRDGGGASRGEGVLCVLARGRFIPLSFMIARCDDFHTRLEAYVFDVGVQVAAKASKCSKRAVYHWLHGATPQPFRRELIIKAMAEHERRDAG